MAEWSDIVTLIAVASPPPEAETDNAGFYLSPTETRREVFCNRQSVGYSEFYKSAQEGMTAKLKITIRTDEYNAENYVEYAEKRYKILRSYVTKNGEFTELTLTDITEREEQAEPEGGDWNGGI
jgi:hypothetical protein